MPRIPVRKGTRVAVMRHAISETNEGDISALEQARRRPAQMPGQHDSPLSPMGRLQSYFAGRYLKEIFSTEEFRKRGLVAHSTLERARQTAKLAMHYGGLQPIRILQSDFLAERQQARTQFIDCQEPIAPERDMSLGDLSDMRELIRQDPMIARSLEGNPDLQDMTPFLLASFRSSMHHFYQAALAKNGRVGPESIRELRKAAAIKALSDWGANVMPKYSEWLIAQDELGLHEQRKTPSGENFSDLKARVYKFFDDFLFAQAEIKGGALAYVVTHSFLFLALRQYIEGFSNQELDYILEQDGPPFPTHVGIVLYKEENGFLVRDMPPGVDYLIPPEFEVYGRRLRFKESVPDSVIREACRVTGVTELEKFKHRHRPQKRKNSDQRFRFSLPPENKKKPGLATAGNERAKTEKKAS